MSDFQVGVFLPIGEHGFIISTNSPPIHATYHYNKEVALLAESLDFDFIFSMIKYRAIGVDSPFWHSTLESITLSSALAECTQRIQIVGSVCTLTVPPAVMAKMVTTIDHISDGRFGLNIVTGAFPSEWKQMGLWQLDHDARYDQAAEYVTCLKRLWTEERVTFKGEYYNLEDCESNPKPLCKPSPSVVCAGVSDKGLRFTAQHGDAAFITGATIEVIGQKAAEVKRLAAEHGRSIRAMASVIPIGGQTEAEAQARYRHYVEGRDTRGVDRLRKEIGISGSSLPEEMLESLMFFGTTLVGDADQIADRLFELHQNGIDGAVVMFPDYISDQIWLAEQVMPRLRERLGNATTAQVAGD